MAIKNLIGFVFHAKEDASVFQALESLTKRFDAHAACVLGAVIPVASFGALDGYVGVLSVDLTKYVTDMLNEESVRVRAALRRSENEAEFATLESFDGDFENLASRRARYADLSIIRRPDGTGSAPRSNLVDALLMNSGRPVLVVPPVWKANAIGNRVLLAWDGSKESARALYDARSLFQPGAEVFVATVNADEDVDRFGEVPGHDIALYLARYGLKTTVVNETSQAGGVSATLLKVALERNVDMIVMGAYRHSRVQQALFGGVTHNLLGKAEVPLLLAH